MSDITWIYCLTEKLCLSCTWPHCSEISRPTLIFTYRSKFKTPHFGHKATHTAHASPAFVLDLSPLASMVLDSSDIAYKCEGAEQYFHESFYLHSYRSDSHNSWS